ncbi:hypothetical protein GCM10028820_12670 [Tessaracoccus terricola]
MADWPIWVWVLIAVIALIIIVAIIFGTRRKDEVDPDGPFAPDQPLADTPQTPRRGVTPDPVDDVGTEPSTSTSPGRRAEDFSATDEDEETLSGPLTVPDDVAAAGVSASDAGIPSDGIPTANAAEATDQPGTGAEPVEDFAADAPTEAAEASPSGWAEERTGETAGDPPPQRPEDDFAPDEPVTASPDGMASQDPEPHFEPPEGDGDVAVEPADVADEGRAVEAVPETAPAPATEPEQPQASPPRDIGSPDDNDPPEMDFTPPKHTDGTEYGDPVREVTPDDDVPRDDLGRRLDPYGNPVD